MRIRDRRDLRIAIGGIAGYALAAWASAQGPAADQFKVAGDAITDQRTLCNQDGGRLWGRSLCGPMMLVDPQTRTIYTDRNTPNRDLQTEGSLFVGKLPPDIGIANTAIDWAGIRWTMVMLPLPSDRDRRTTLLMHESFHRIQPDRLPPPMATLPDHLDTFDGRVLMRLEWRALSRALQTHGRPQREAIRDALAFRAARRTLLAEAPARENALEINEGMAEYTGKRLGAGSHAASSTIATLVDYDRQDGYVRSFAYASGPAYGLLLDRFAPRWRDGVRSDSDLGVLLHRAIGDVALPSVSSVRDRYGYTDIRSEEAAKASVHALQAAHWQKVLVDGPVIRLPLADVQIEFNPRTLFALPPSGTVYPSAIVHDAWGTLTVQHGVLIAKNWKSASISGPAAAHRGDYEGPGWTLKLLPGWALSNGAVRRQSN